MKRYIINSSKTTYGKIKEDKHYRNSKNEYDEVFKDELFTLNEIKKNGIPESFYDVVEIPSKDTYFSFGVRKELPKDSKIESSVKADTIISELQSKIEKEVADFMSEPSNTISDYEMNQYAKEAMEIKKYYEEHPEELARLQEKYPDEFEDEDTYEYDEYTVEVEELKDNRIKAEVRAELSYEEMENLIEVLDPIVQQYDKYSYFEMADSGIADAYLDI